MAFVAWSNLSWPEAERYGSDPASVGVIPLGAIEQHGPHLPLATDTLIAERLAQAVAERIVEPLLVTPAITGGLSEHHLGFAGTMTLTTEAFGGAIDAVLDSFDRAGVRRVALLSAHGGNFGYVAELVQRRADGALRVVGFSDLAAYFDAMFATARELGVEPPASDIHAGALETALAQHLFPELVRDHWREVTGEADDGPDFVDRILTEGVRSVSETGVLGTPGLASPELGAAIFEQLVTTLVDWLADEPHVTPTSRLAAS